MSASPYRDTDFSEDSSREDVLAADTQVMSSEESSSDLAPKIQAQFHDLSSVLAETNENLVGFEFMLQQYTQLAKIRPLISKKEDEEAVAMSTTQVEQSQRLEGLLGELVRAVSVVGELKDKLGEGDEGKAGKDVGSEALKRQNEELRTKCSQYEQRLGELQRRNDFLESEWQTKTKMCDQLMESVHRAREGIREERDRNQKLDEKLEKEKVAARKIGQDITRYVEQMRGLENEVVTLKRERNELKRQVKRTTTTSTTVPRLDMHGDVLTATFEEKEEDLLRERLREETERRKALERKVAKHEDQVKDYEGQLRELKGGLERLQVELEEKCRSVSPSQKETTEKDDDMQELREILGLKTKSPVAEKEIAKKDVTAYELQRLLEKREEDLKSLRSKSKTLLKQYRQKKTQMESQNSKISAVKKSLVEILSGFKETETNYVSVLSHLGSEIEIAVRLLAAYLNVPLTHQPIRISGRRLSDWFCDVQALSTWLRRQLVAFGKRVWTDREPPGLVSKALPFPEIPVRNNSLEEHNDDQGTLSQITALEREDVEEEEDTLATERNRSIREVVHSQDRMMETRSKTLEHLLSALQ